LIDVQNDLPYGKTGIILIHQTRFAFY